MLDVGMGAGSSGVGDDRSRRSVEKRRGPMSDEGVHVVGSSAAA